MAATTKLLQLRPKTLPITTTTSTPTSLHFFSSTTPEPNINPSSQPNPSPSPPPQPPPPPPPPPPRSQSPFSSYFSDVKASLKQPKQQQRNPQSEPPRKPFSFGSSNPTQHTSPPKIASLEEIRKNLSEFRRRSVTPPPPPPPPSSTSSSTLAPPHSPQHISFQELYQRNVASRGEDSNPDEAKSDGRLSFEAIRESLSKLKSSPLRNQGEGSGSMKEFMSLSKFRENLNMRPVDPTAKPSRMVGSGNFPLSVFGDEIKEKEGDNVDAKIMTEFVRNYNHEELGKKLVALRPEKKGDTWFSLEELNERLVKLREMEEKESDSRIAGTGIGFKDLRKSLQKMRDIDQEKARKSTIQRLDILGQMGRTPGYMLSPPKDELIEKYFHPDNMSASEKLKLELGKVRDEFKLSASDCGSARVQVAQLTTKIKHLSTALHKKDKHSRKGLQAMVQRRKKLLKYLRRTDWDSYCFVLSKLGLRDNPDYKN